MDITLLNCFLMPPQGAFAMSGKFVQRLAKSLHAKLSVLAKQGGVSLNTLVLTFVVEGVGMREEKRHAQ